MNLEQIKMKYGNEMLVKNSADQELEERKNWKLQQLKKIRS